jgi:HK97 family phage major capsid protein
VVQLNGEGRAIVDGSIPEAIWTEMAGAVEEMQDAFEAVEIDGYKVGGFIPVANAYLEDSMINLAVHIESRIARSIGKALDKAILIGTGLAGKQPEGIIPAILANKKSSTAKLGTLLSFLGDVDAGEEDENEVIAVMTRKTYYKHILGQTVVNTADGRQVVGDVKNPNIAGLRVKLVSYMPANAVLFGAFKKYILGERKGVQIASSTEVRFIQDQTVFKGTARYDGKPADVDGFQLVELTDLETPAGA